MKKYDLVVLGAGSGGLSAASGAANIGLKVLLIEKNKLGGDCLWNGCIPSKTLIHEADKMLLVKEENFFGANEIGTENKFDFPKHFEEAKKRIKMVQTEIAKTDSIERFTELGVDVIIGEAKFLGKNKVKIAESEIKFKKCIIATGSRPLVPEMFSSVKYITNEQVFDLEKLPESLTIIGGGSIGVEIASAFSMFGTKVKMVLKEEFVMAKEEPVTREFMTTQLQKLGVEIFKKGEVQKVLEIDGKSCVELQNGVILKSDILMLAVGRQFNSDIDLEKAGIKIGTRKEIIIDEYLQTSNRRVYAIGDVNGKMLFTHAAGYQAKAVLQNLLVPRIFWWKKKKSVPTAFPWVTYTYPEVAHVGKYIKDLEDNKINFKEYITKLEHVDRAKTGKVEEEGFIQVLVGNKGKIEGVTIVAPHAGELITEWVLAMEYNLPVESIFNTVHAYPTLSELNPRGTFQYMKEKLTPTNKKLLKFLFWIN